MSEDVCPLRQRSRATSVSRVAALCLEARLVHTFEEVVVAAIGTVQARREISLHDVATGEVC